ncbi:hypothetical protein ES332_D12G130400v1 [Gossypium tomentosum]|uniref:Myb-like domain-containing protein n=1 Tax=Gossypium tomentosum TaxID=34277 RepID=A0A5D2I9F8_GOSTO|nr:hypothetical protein ES332_D12G130400v1 [Gossypium tomentosum]
MGGEMMRTEKREGGGRFRVGREGKTETWGGKPDVILWSLNSLPPQPHPPPSSSVSTSAAGNTGSYSEDPNKKIRKPDTITKSKESWTEQEHDKSLEALQLFDHDLKKIGAFVGSKTVIQIHSHAQNYFLKVQKAAHGYPQKAPKNAIVVSQVAGPSQSSSALLNSGYMYRQDSSSMLRNPIATSALSSWNYNSMPPVSMMQHWLDHLLCIILVTVVATKSLPELDCLVKPLMEGVIGRNLEVTMPDFAEVYSFIDSVFDPSGSGHLQKLKQLDPINFETALLLMRNLCVNLTSPEFEDHVIIKSNAAEPEAVKLGSSYSINLAHISANTSPIA